MKPAFYILDTNVVIELRDRHPGLRRRVEALDAPLQLSIVTRIELEGGVYRDESQIAVRRPRVDAILASIPTLVFDLVCANAYRGIVEITGYSRRKLLDRMIAAQALVHRATLITLNGDDFRDVPELTYEDWSVGFQRA